MATAPDTSLPLPQRIAAIRESFGRLQGSVDPETLEARLAELERPDAGAGLLGRLRRRRQGLLRARAHGPQARGVQDAASPMSPTSTPSRRWRPRTPTMQDEVDRAGRDDRGAAGGARGGAAVQRQVRRRRRARHGQRRRRRHRRAGLGGDGAADGDALGRVARLQRRAARGQRGGGGRHQVRRVPRRRGERLRPVRRREGRAPARAHLAVRLARAAARRRSRASRSRR